MASESVGSCAAFTPEPPITFLEETRCSQNTPDRALYKKNVCFTCSREGHWSKDCPSKSKPSHAPPANLVFAKAPDRSPLREGVQSSQNTPDRGLYKKDVCFSCNQEGHWCKDCPLKFKRPNTPAGATSPLPAGRDYPDIQCPCGGGACVVRTSKTEKNPFRDFYCCPVKLMSERCSFFLWCDKVKPGQHHGVAEPPHPMCSCNAGRCSLLTMQDGEFAGRKYFACPIEKGQGACNHFQWYDSPANLCEPKMNHAMENELPSFILMPKEPKNPIMDNKGATESKDGSKSEETIVPASPPPLPGREREANDAGLRSSPMKRLSLHEGSPSKLGKCFKCGKEGHWMIECVASPTSPCFKCGKFGHWKNNCTA